MEGHGLSRPRFAEVGSEFRVTLMGPGKRFMEEMTARPAWAEGLNERQVEAVLYVGEHGQITNREYRDLTGVSRRWATKELQEMVELGIMAVQGSGRTTHYVLVRD
jgi:ATP-dependent DNA helicase RecG